MRMVRENALDGTILDVNLHGRPCFPICSILSAGRIPFVFLTGYPAAAIPIEYRSVTQVTKPFEPTEMKEVLADMLRLPQGWPGLQHHSSLRHERKAGREGLLGRHRRHPFSGGTQDRHSRSVAPFSK